MVTQALLTREKSAVKADAIPKVLLVHESSHREIVHDAVLKELCSFFPERNLTQLTVANSANDFRKLALEAMQMANQCGAEKIWCVLQGETTIDIAARLAQDSGKQVVTQVCEPPETWLRENEIASFDRHSILRKFQRALSRSESCATGSMKMAQDYREQYGCNTIPLISGISERLSMPAAERIHDREAVIVGIASELYAEKELKGFLKMLDRVDWRIGGRTVLVRVTGRKFKCSSSHPVHLEYHGSRSVAEAIRVLNGCDVLFFADLFDRPFEREMRHSSPSRLATYLASGRPILYHGPKYSPCHQLLCTYEAGIVCDTDPDEPACAAVDLYNGIDRFIFDHDFYAFSTGNARKAFIDNLTNDGLKSRFFRFLGVSE